MSTSWWMDKPNVLCPHNEILFSNRKEQNTAIGYNMDEPKNKQTKNMLKEARCKNYIYYVISFILNVKKGGGWECILTANKLNRIFRMIAMF